MVLTMEEAIPCRVWLRDHALMEESPLTGRRGMATGKRLSRTGVSLGVYPCESPALAKVGNRRPSDPDAHLPRMSISARCVDKSVGALRRRSQSVPIRETRCRQSVNIFASLHLSLSLFRGAASPARLISLRPRPTRFFAPNRTDRGAFVTRNHTPPNVTKPFARIPCGIRVRSTTAVQDIAELIQ